MREKIAVVYMRTTSAPKELCVDAVIAFVISELESTSLLKEEQRTALKIGFSSRII